MDEAKPELLAGKYIFTSEKGLHLMDSLGLKVQLLRTFDDYHITTLDMKFINRKTREQELKKKFLVKAGTEN